ncbi:hypothetical protein NH340_JMT04395 [Sarcoptes scabiei]|nr:hypothetical protein NH340_JMT04395 [Sarcoptes scabiei]
MIARRNLSTLTRILHKSSSSSNNGRSKKNATNDQVSSEKSSRKSKAKDTKSSNDIETAEPETFRNDQYNCPQYYGYNRFSFFDLVEQMAQNRLPQRSNQNKY